MTTDSLPRTDLGRRLLASRPLIGTWATETLADMICGIEADAARSATPPADPEAVETLTNDLFAANRAACRIVAEWMLARGWTEPLDDAPDPATPPADQAALAFTVTDRQPLTDAYLNEVAARTIGYTDWREKGGGWVGRVDVNAMDEANRDRNWLLGEVTRLRLVAQGVRVAPAGPEFSAVFNADGSAQVWDYASGNLVDEFVPRGVTPEDAGLREDLRTVASFASPYRCCMWIRATRSICEDVDPKRPDLWCRFCAAHARVRAVLASRDAASQKENNTNEPTGTVARGAHSGGLPELGVSDVSGGAATRSRLPGPDRPPRPPRSPKDREWDGS